MNSRPRAVLDTNTVVSALLFASGRLTLIRAAWQAGAFTPIVSTETTTELIRVLSYPKFKLASADRDELLGDYLPFCSTVRIPAKTPRIPDCRDPFDLPFLKVAASGKADYLVTGDRDLLEISKRQPYAIVNAEAFISQLKLR